MPPNQTTTALLIKERKKMMSKLDTLQQLLKDATARQALQSHKLSVSFQNQHFSINLSSGIDLETHDLLNQFSKLWLWEEPDESFFRATHPALVKLRQDGIPRWKQSNRWNNWSDWVSLIKYQDLLPAGVDLTQFPKENESRHLCQLYMTSCNWYYELLTESECKAAQVEMYRFLDLGLTPTSPEQWTRIALVLATCRLTLSCLKWVGTAESAQFTTKRCIRLRNWCDLCIMALCQAGFDQNPTLEALRVLLMLTSTIFFETDCGLMMGTPQLLKLHRLAIDVSERLNLHRDPPAHLSPKEKDDRRRMWWALVTNDSHFAAGKTSQGPLGLQNSDTKYPVAQVQEKSTYVYSAGKSSYLDLRSPHSRFELGKFNNRYYQLLAHRRPLATVSDIWELDRQLVAMEASVVPEQRLISDYDLSNFSQKQSEPFQVRDDVLRYAQQTFYTGFWHIRSRIHRGLLYREQSSSHPVKSHIDVDAHRDIVSRCSYCMLHLYRSINLPTAFTASIATAALTVLLELLYQPSHPHNRDRRTIVSDCLLHLQTNTSPVIGRACQVLEYFLEPIQPQVEIVNNNSAGLDGRQEIDTLMACIDGFVQEPSQVSAVLDLSNLNVAQEGLSVRGSEQKDAFHPVPNPMNFETEAEYLHQPFDLLNKQPTIQLTNHIPDLSTTHNLLTFHGSQSNDSSINQFIDLILNNYPSSLDQQSRSLNAPAYQIGYSNPLAASAEPVTNLETVSPSTIPRGYDVIDSYPTDYLNTCAVSTIEPPTIELAKPTHQVVPNDLLLTIWDRDSSFQRQDLWKSSTREESFDSRLSGDSKNLREGLVIHDGSSFSIGSTNSSKSPMSNILPSGHLTHDEPKHTWTTTNSEGRSSNANDEFLRPSYHQGADGSLAASKGLTLEDGILNQVGQSDDDLLPALVSDLYQYFLKKSFPNGQNPPDVQLNNLKEQTQDRVVSEYK